MALVRCLVMTIGEGRDTRRRVAAVMATSMLAAGMAVADGTTLTGPTWIAEDIGGQGVMEGLQSRIAFKEDGNAHGSGGCNDFSGRYTVVGDTLGIGPLASTRKARPPAVMSQEARFHQALPQVRRFRFENGLLHLTDDQGQVVARLRVGE